MSVFNVKTNEHLEGNMAQIIEIYIHQLKMCANVFY